MYRGSMLISWNRHSSNGKKIKLENFYPTLIVTFLSRPRLLTFPMGNYGSSIIDNEDFIKIRRDKIFAFALCATCQPLSFLEYGE